MSDYFSKPGTLLWTRTLGRITCYYQKPTKASLEHELHVHACKLSVTDEVEVETCVTNC